MFKMQVMAGVTDDLEPWGIGGETGSVWVYARNMAVHPRRMTATVLVDGRG